MTSGGNKIALEIDSTNIDMTTRAVIAALAKQISMVEWLEIISFRIDDFNIIRGLHEKRQGVLKVVHDRWNKQVFGYDEVDVKVFSCKTLEDAIFTAKSTVDIMLGNAIREESNDSRTN